MHLMGPLPLSLRSFSEESGAEERTVMAGVARSVLAVVVLVIVLASCGDDDAVIGTTPASATFPTVTHTMAPSLSDVSAWEPADEIPTALETSLAALLESNGAWMLLPSAAPGEGPTSAEVITLTPGNDPTAVRYNLVVRPSGSGEVVLSLSSIPVDLDPCGSLFPEYSLTAIRGVEGCSLMVDGGVDFLNWVEDGRWFHAEWDEIDLGVVVSWLETWRRIP